MNQRDRSAAAFRRLAPVARLLNRVALVVLREDTSGQGRHVDPDDPQTPPPSRARWTAAHTAALDSPTMTAFTDALRPPDGGTPRDGVLGELGEYFGMTPDEALEHCLGWEEDSLKEWEAAPRDSLEGIANFYDTGSSWAFDLAWYSYMQTSGTGYPKTVIVADHIALPEGSRVLDYGSGIGVTAQTFAALGCEVTLADVAAPLLKYAQWRLERRGTAAHYLHLPTALPRGRFDAVTALDVLAHVPPADLRATCESLYATLRPNGWFVTGYDVRRASENNAWHLYEDDLPLRWEVARAGFRTEKLIDGSVWVYRAGPRTGLGHKVFLARSWLQLASPPARAIRAVRRAGARLVMVAFYRFAAR